MAIVCVLLFVYGVCSDEIRTLTILFSHVLKVAFMCFSFELMFLSTYFT